MSEFGRAVILVGGGVLGVDSGRFGFTGVFRAWNFCVNLDIKIYRYYRYSDVDIILIKVKG